MKILLNPLGQQASSYVQTISCHLGIEDPRLLDLLTCWHLLRKGRRMPSRSDFDFPLLGPWLGYLMLLDVLGSSRFRYRVYGSAVAALLGRDLQGREVDDLPADVREETRGDYLAVVASREPRFVERQRDIHGRSESFGKLILPLSDNGEAVTMLLAAFYPAGR